MNYSIPSLHNLRICQNALNILITVDTHTGRMIVNQFDLLLLWISYNADIYASKLQTFET